MPARLPHKQLRALLHISSERVAYVREAPMTPEPVRELVVAGLAAKDGEGRHASYRLTEAGQEIARAPYGYCRDCLNPLGHSDCGVCNKNDDD